MFGLVPTRVRSRRTVQPKRGPYDKGHRRRKRTEPKRRQRFPRKVPSAYRPVVVPAPGSGGAAAQAGNLRLLTRARNPWLLVLGVALLFLVWWHTRNHPGPKNVSGPGPMEGPVPGEWKLSAPMNGRLQFLIRYSLWQSGGDDYEGSYTIWEPVIIRGFKWTQYSRTVTNDSNGYSERILHYLDLNAGTIHTQGGWNDRWIWNTEGVRIFQERTIIGIEIDGEAYPPPWVQPPPGQPWEEPQPDDMPEVDTPAIPRPDLPYPPPFPGVDAPSDPGVDAEPMFSPFSAPWAVPDTLPAQRTAPVPAGARLMLPSATVAPIPTPSPAGKTIPAGSKVVTTPAGNVQVDPVSVPETLAGIAAEVGRIETKLKQVLARPDPEIPDPSEILGELLGMLEDLLADRETPDPAGSYQMDSACELDEEGFRRPPVVVPFLETTGSTAAILKRLDALAVLLQVHKDLKQPGCKHPRPQGDAVTVQFSEI